MLNSKLEYKGIWYLPNNPELKYSGNLIYDPSNGILLDYIGNLKSERVSINEFEEPNDAETIHGHDIDGNKITLVDCFETSWKSHGKGLRTAVFKVKYAFIGTHFFDLKMTSLKSGSFETTIFKNWWWKTGFNYTKENNLHDYIIDYKSVNTNNFEINSILSILFSMASRLEMNFNDYSIKEMPNIIFKYKELILFDDLINDYNHLKYFFCIPFFKISTPKSIIVTDYSDVKFNVLISHVQKDEEYTKSNRFFFKFDECINFLPNILKAWFAQRNKLLLITPLLYNNFQEENSVENLFLNIIQAIEYFHRIYGNNEIEPYDVYKSKKSSIIDIILDPEHKAWLINKLHHANEPSLKARIEDLVSKINFTQASNLFETKYIKKIVNTRNLLNHSGDLTNDECFRDSEDFLQATEKLRVLLVCNILLELECPKDWLTLMLEENLGRVSTYC